MSDIIKQPIRISLLNGKIIVKPQDRDLFENEQLEWICSEPEWEAVFKQAGANTPFADDTYGPGVYHHTAVLPGQESEVPQEELPNETTGTLTNDAPEGDYHYQIFIPGSEPVMARVRVRRQLRPV